MRAHFYRIPAALLVFLVTGEILYRDYEQGDKYPSIMMAATCKYKQGIPCHVAINSTKGPHSAVGYIVMDLPYAFEPDQEAAIRNKMRNPEKKGSFGYIELVEVVKASQGRGIGTALLGSSIERGRVTQGTLALTLRVYPDNVRAIELYKKLHFIKVMSKAEPPWKLFIELISSGGKQMDLYAYYYESGHFST